jgi:hypothetical protein
MTNIYILIINNYTENNFSLVDNDSFIHIMIQWEYSDV